MSSPLDFGSSNTCTKVKLRDLQYVLLFASIVCCFRLVESWHSHSPVVSSASILQYLSEFLLQIHVIEPILCAFFIENRIATRVKLAVTSDSKVCATNSNRCSKPFSVCQTLFSKHHSSLTLSWKAYTVDNKRIYLRQISHYRKRWLLTFIDLLKRR